MKAAMRVTIVNTHDLVGGAERCSYELASGLRQRGDQVSLIVGRRFGDDPFVVQMKYRWLDWRLRSFAYGWLGLTDTTIAAPLYECFRMPELREADVYNIHNMHGAYWNFWTVPLLARRAPVVLTLHDEWLLTGDCAYTYSCERWRDHCGRCPQAREPESDDRVCIGGRDATWLNLKLKRAMFRCAPGRSVVLVSPSRWLADRAGEAPHLARFERRVVPNGVDLEVFRPRESAPARREAGLPPDAFLVLTFAANLFDRRKDLHRLLAATRSTRWPADARLVVAGRATPELERELAGDPRIVVRDYVSGREDLARLLAAVDLVVVPSRAENLPYAALEAQACGTPVLGARVGGIPETLEDGASGWLFDPACESEALAETIAAIRALPPDRREAARARARANATRRFGHVRFVEAYRELFAELAEQPLPLPARRNRAAT